MQETSYTPIEKAKNAIENLSYHESTDNPKISVIIPSYNSANYITRCLVSILNQTIKELEIIVINDGSTDETLQILDLFKEKDKRLVIYNQENLKQGNARNNGIKVARGEYIGFIDSDDWIDSEYYEKLYNAAKKYDSDIAVANYVRIGNGKTKKRLTIEHEDVYTDLDGKFEICKQAKHPSPTNKIYRSELLKNNNILFPEGVFCEDKIFTLKAVYYANSVVSVPDIYYYYYRRQDSTVHTKTKKHKQDKIKAKQDVLKFLREHNVHLKQNDFWAIKKDYKLLGIRLYLIKESLKTEKHLLFGFIPIRECSIDK